MATVRTRTERWFGGPRPGPEAEVLLFCLPYAGGGASAYRLWPGLLPDRIAVLPAELPGRERRITEPATVDVAELADAVQARADRPYGIYGHSMGGRLGFALASELLARGFRPPLRLAVGGARPPDEYDPMLDIVDLPDDAFAEELVALGGTPGAVFADPELRELILPALRADFRWLRDGGVPGAPPIPVPIDAYAGDVDPIADVEVLAGWARHGTAGFELHRIPGGHFLVQDPPPELTDRLAADLLGSPR